MSSLANALPLMRNKYNTNLQTQTKFINYDMLTTYRWNATYNKIYMLI